MKSLSVIAKVFALSLICFLWSCQADQVEPGTNENSTVKSVSDGHAHPVLDPECSPRIAYPLMDLGGGLNVNYFGPFGNPTNPPTPWGTVTLVNNDEYLALEIDLAYGWYVDWTQTFIGNDSSMSISNGIPVVDNSWISDDVDPMLNTAETWIPLSSLSSSNLDWSMRLSIVRMDFFQGVDMSSRTELWAFNSGWNDPAQPTLNSSCFAACKWNMVSCPSLGSRGPSTIE